MSTGQQVSDDTELGHEQQVPMWRFFLYSTIGAVVFFVPLEINGKDTIALDHIVTAINDALPSLTP